MRKLFHQKETESSADKRRSPRRKFGYYLPVVNQDDLQLLGYISDISRKGFKMDCRKAIQAARSYNLHLDLSPEISDTTFITFTAFCQWCQVDPLNPTEHIAGFEIVSIDEHDNTVFQRIFEQYGQDGRW